MQKLAPLLVGVLLAWLSAAQAASPDYIIQSNDAPLNPVRVMQQRPASSPAGTPQSSAPAPASAPASSPLANAMPPAKIHIGLILPTESKELGQAAQVVRAGFAAASQVDNSADISYINEQSDDLVSRYRATVASGVSVIVGPLTRSGIAQIAPYVSVPTLALNTLEPGLAPNQKLLSLSLSVEGEARQMARQMHADGQLHPLLVAADDVLSQRLSQAFVSEWVKLTKSAPPMLQWPLSEPITSMLRHADSLFIAMNPPEAAALKAALPKSLAVYATSQLNTRHPESALEGIRFIDMPWLLMPDRETVKRYPRPNTELSLTTERLYALGIDAYRLAIVMAQQPDKLGQLKLHGVTGELKLGADRQFQRQLPLGVIFPQSAK